MSWNSSRKISNGADIFAFLYLAVGTGVEEGSGKAEALMKVVSGAFWWH